VQATSLADDLQILVDVQHLSNTLG
jgi:hypothetical protein